MWGDRWEPAPSTASSTSFTNGCRSNPSSTCSSAVRILWIASSKLQKAYWAGFFSGVVDQRYIDYRVRIGEIHAQRDLPSLIYFAAVLRFQLLFMEELQSQRTWQRPAVASNCARLPNCWRSTPM